MDEKKNERDFSDFNFDAHSTKKYAPPREKDTTTVLFGESGKTSDTAGFKIPQADGSGMANKPKTKQIRTSDYRNGGAKFSRYNAPSNRGAAKTEVKDVLLRQYATGGRYLTNVMVRSWPGARGFYEKFVSDAALSHVRRGEPAPHVPYFSYIPQYSQLTPSMWKFYLWFKESVRRGERLQDADFSYVILYVYEIINLEGIISPKEGAELLARIWVMYRAMHPSLDKYLCEWMADYCLVHMIPLPRTLNRILCEVGAKARLKEFYADAAIASGLPLGPLVRLALSDHNLTKGRYVREIEGFADEVCAVFDTVIAEHMEKGIGLFEGRLNKPTELVCDAYCGSLCASTVKKKVHLTLNSFFRLPEARRIVTELMKGCENIVRARHGIKARLSVPPVTGSSYVITARSVEEVTYMSYYDSPAEELTPERAAEIEAVSWQNVAALAAEDVMPEVSNVPDNFEEPEGAFFSDSISDEHEEAKETFVTSEGETPAGAESAVETAESSEDTVEPSVKSDGGMSEDEKLKKALWAAADGGSFNAACRELGLFADSAASKINEAALEFIGDVVLEQSGTDYSFIEDYIDDIGLLF